MTVTRNLLSAGLVILSFSSIAFAAKAGKDPKHLDWNFEGYAGTYDRASVQRGFHVFRQICSSCHSLKYFKFRNLEKMGFSGDEIKAIAAEFEVAGEPDEYGDPTTRAGLPQDGIPMPFANENAARSANGGAYPPDLSVITRARHGGANYIYSLLTGYEPTPPEKEEIVGLKYYNPYYPGEAISMAPPLGDGYLDYADGTEATLEQTSKDVTQFLNYVADPHLEKRKSTGFATILYLLVFTILLYFSKRRIWKPVKEGRNVVEEAEKNQK